MATFVYCRCYFHFVKAVKKSTKNFGLRIYGHFDDQIQQLCCVALLPNDSVQRGFDYVDDQMPDSSQWIRFRRYWHRQWAGANISVYGLKNRTNNFSETLNRSSNLLSGRPHQCIWSVIRTLKHVETEKTDELLKHTLGKMFKKKSSTYMNELNKKIMDATLDFEQTGDVGQFLRNVSYRSDILRSKL